MIIRTLTLLLALCAPLAWGQTTPQPATAPASAAVLDTRLALRDLWVEHIFWVRNYALANQAGNTAQAQSAVKQVVANATAIANSLQPLYGQPAADQLLKLLAGHWGAIKDYSDASVTKDPSKQKSAVDALTSNARAIAAFLAKANPYLAEDSLVSLLGAHGGHHITQIDQLARSDYSGEAQTWQAMREHILAIADALAGALAKQFPDKF
ncbi:hypothetical protein [Pseudomonas oryzae]|uniref:Uncharacterized protein n=1 Tax=Pseudomonas oryzae TaxID=1392877 RepID=A0A1H1YIF1_9PSED|nr:hypothetical protein [Pseudomonas oryzae]SDT21141.1 hypothetical protein SAMN05216221_3806 [Pseudomonas oryzae]